MAFRVFEHTADIGLEVEAHDLPTLFQEAAHGLFSVIRGDSRVDTSEQVPIQIEANRLDRAMVDWLEEFLFHQDASGLVFSDVRDVAVHIDGKDTARTKARGGSSPHRISVSGTARGEPFSRERHPGCLHVKAITRHELSVLPPHGTSPARARVILDI